jgi:hypothetical protein
MYDERTDRRRSDGSPDRKSRKNLVVYRDILDHRRERWLETGLSFTLHLGDMLFVIRSIGAPSFLRSVSAITRLFHDRVR